ncbi:MAG: hypothetical protein M1497_14020 [Nitrospirae bacterium]|nr:hypothetical protein [Nitrospirota bacterium]
MWTSIKRAYVVLENLFLKISPFLMLGVGYFAIKTYCNEQANTLILFFTLFILTFYVKDTNRIANAAVLQARISWMFQMFSNFSTRIDALKDFLNRRNAESWETHKDDMTRYFNVFSNLFVTRKGKLYIEEKRDFFKSLSEKRENGEPIDDEIIEFLTELKEELQWKIIDLT